MLEIQLKVLQPLNGKDPYVEADALGAALKFDHEFLSDQMHLGLRPMHRVDRNNPIPRYIFSPRKVPSQIAFADFNDCPLHIASLGWRLLT